MEMQLQSGRAQGLYQAKATHLTCTQSKSHDLMGSPSSKIKHCVGYPLHCLSLSFSLSLANAFPFEPEPKSNLFGHSDGHKIFVAWARLGIY